MMMSKFAIFANISPYSAKSTSQRRI